MTANIEDFGLDMVSLASDPISTITKAHKAFESALASYKDAGEKQSSGVKAIVSHLEQSPDTFSENVLLVTKLREQIYHVLTNAPEVSFLLFNSLDDIKSGVSAFRDEAKRGIKLPTEEPTDEDNENQATAMERWEIVSMLHSFMNSACVMALGNMLTVKDLKVSDLPEGVRKMNDKTKKLVVKLPNLPSKPEGDNTLSAGRPVLGSTMSYTINGVEIPKGTGLHFIALHYCSTPEEWITGSELQTLIDEAEKDVKLSDKGNWEIKTPNGTLVGTKQAKQ